MKVILVSALAGSLYFAALTQAASQSHDCVSALSEQKESEIAAYIVKKYRLSPSVNVKLTSAKEVGDTCYRELTFAGTSPVNTWHLTLYLSPDQRFLMDEMFDTTVDPREDERRKADALMTDLAQSKGASRGPEAAPVTIVVFSDFECPYCQRSAEILREVLPDEKERVRVVFHHLPLSMHAWARSAAEAAACAQLQNADAFWSIHDYLFAHQNEITPENLKQKLTTFAKGIKALDFSKFQDCQQNQMSLGLVLRDLNLASANNIAATPTFFINGRRLQGIKDAVQLKQLIADTDVQGSTKSGSAHVNGH